MLVSVLVSTKSECLAVCNVDERCFAAKYDASSKVCEKGRKSKSAALELGSDEIYLKVDTCLLGERLSESVKVVIDVHSPEACISLSEKEGTCLAAPVVVDHSSYMDCIYGCHHWDADGDLLDPACEDFDTGNYWLSKEIADWSSGTYPDPETEGFFVLDLGCCREVERVHLRNTNNDFINRDRCVSECV